MFLVTTSLHEYQDKADDLLFLGEWCLPGRDKDMIPPGKEYRVLPYLWQDPVERRDAYGFCKTFYDRAISGLAGLMNEIHETNLSDRYWKILVGPWLLFYTHVLYDRYRCIVKAFREYPGARTAGISPSSFWTIYDWHHYTAGVINDYYNLQLYCQIMTALGISYEVRDDGPWRAGLQRTMDSSYYLAASGNKTRLCRQAIHKGLAWIFNGKNRKTVVSGLFNRNINHYFLAAATGFQVGILPRVPRDLEEIRRANRPSQELRRSFDTIELDSPDQIFSKVFAKTLAHNFPCCYLEDFRRRRQCTRRDYGAIKVVASAYGWISDENFKFAAAEAAEKGACLIGSQHGGNNGIERDILYEQHVAEVVDKYYTYGGWSTTNTAFPNALPGTALEFNPKYTNKKVEIGSRKQLLLVGTSSPRYLTHFRSGPYYSQFKEYQHWQGRVMESVSVELRGNLLCRLRDTIWQSKQVLLKHFSELNFDDYSLKFDEQVSKSRVVVIDNLYTTFTQTLLMNRPVILFFNPHLTDVYDEAMPVLTSLREVGILHYTPEDAAKQLSQVWNAPDGWWFSSEVQKVRKEFINSYAVHGSHWFKQWLKILR